MSLRSRQAVIDYVTSQLTTQNEFRKYLGIVTFSGGLLIIPASALLVQKTIFFFLGLAFVINGLYDLYASNFYRIIRPGVLLTLGIGIQLVALNVVQLWELILLWPLSFILFGTISLFSAVLEDWHQGSAQP